MTPTAHRFVLQSALSLALAACAGDDEGGPPGQQSPGFDAGTQADAALSSFDAAATAADAAPAADAARGAEAGAADAAGPIADASQAPTDAARPDATTPASDAASGDAASNLPRFSFFVTSLSAMRQLSGSQNGFGGNLTFGETGDGAGLRGADKICTTIAEMSMPGSGAKGWHAFLSTDAVDARDRIGDGPWYDRQGRVMALTKQALLTGNRPQGADPAIADDFPNERGEPNRAGSAVGSSNDNHDTLTATNTQGVYDGSSTCGDWTSTVTTGSGMWRGPGLGHTWPAMSGQSWVAAHGAPGCAASVNLSQGGGGGAGDGVGALGGYGAIYCFADMP
jgi:hypothetical protein